MKQRKPATKKSLKFPRTTVAARAPRVVKKTAALPDFHPLMHVEYREER